MGVCPIRAGVRKRKWDGKVQGAHRVAWKLTKGPIPDGMFVCHSCDNRVCVRPDHLFLGNAKDNNADMTSKGRRRSRRKLTEDLVRSIRAAYPGETQRSLAIRFGVTQPTIQAIVTRKTWVDLA